MKIVTIVQAKGGSGKTTLAMAIASGAISKGYKVHLMDGDRNPQLSEWPARVKDADWEGIEKPVWPSSATLSIVPATIEELYETLNNLENSGTDLVIIDTRPGTHSDTEDLIFAADLALIPARPTQMEIPLIQDAFVWINKLRDTISKEDHFPTVRIVVSDAPKSVIDASQNKGTDRLSKKDYDVLVKLIQIPHLSTILPNSKVWSHISYYGPLSVAQDAFQKAKAALIAKSLRKQLEIAEVLAEEIMKGEFK